ncbi:parvulin-like peptidyl-prolyl isomerase [Paramagnetospirillum caucaseum]|uniref:Parvulin-like PPIase n=1 Tax=Paramagnetospirillum caucaseum TaxID=1244869 RepID=M2Z3E1_9PROT|nr:SurA N-terminal domain-containing protein [Paramagnetospirillum caucaseum]EME68880.1 parvulin-like peptidyl-prolyl isomerase [Paramagnetospirillum caucaseum]
MLDVFRSASKTWIVRLLFALLALSFVAWGAGDVVRGGVGRSPAIEIGKTSMSAAEVMAEFKREVERLQPLFGGKLTADDARKMGMLDRTIDSLIARTLIDEAARSLGLAATDETILRRVASNPAFKGPTGQFDREIFQARLARLGHTEDSFMKTERTNMVRNQMVETVAAGIGAPQALTDPLLTWREERRTAETFVIKDESTPLPPAPDAAQLEAYYKDSLNRFMAPEFRALTVLLLRPSDVAGDVSIDEVMLNDAYQQRIDEFTTPERRTVSQIVFNEQSAAAQATDMVTGGKDLAAVAKALGAEIIELGTVEKGDLPDGLAEAVFKLASGATGQPVKSALGWHVVKVSQVQAGRTRSFAEAKAQLEQDLRKEKAMDGLSELANKVEDALGGGATLEEAAKRHNLKIVTIAAVDAQGRGTNGKPVADLPKSDQFLDVAFHTDQSTESPLTEVPNNGYFLLRVDGVTPPAPKALADIKAEVLATWQAERRQEQARDKAQKLADRIKAGESAAQVALSAGAKLEAAKPFTREPAEGTTLPATIIAELFNGPAGRRRHRPGAGRHPGGPPDRRGGLRRRRQPRRHPGGPPARVAGGGHRHRRPVHRRPQRLHRRQGRPSPADPRRVTASS